MGTDVRMTCTNPSDRLPDVVERRLRVGGVRVAVREAGHGSPLLLLHGFGDSCATWSAVIGRLARRHHVLAPDLPGFGDSGDLGDGPMLDLLVEAVAGLCDTTGIDTPVAVAGNSMGGAVALRLALDRPEMVSRLVLVDTAGLAVGVPLWWRLLGVQLAPVGAAVAAGAGWLPGGLVERAAGRIYARLAFHDGNACASETRRAFARHYRRGDDVRRIAAQGTRLVQDLSDGRLIRDSVRLRQPVLVVWGRYDRLVPIADGERLLRAVPHARMQVIEQCGHCPQLEQPDRFLTAVEPFLRALNGARAMAQPQDDAEALPA